MMPLRIAILFGAAFVSMTAAFAQNQPTSSGGATALLNHVPDSCPVTKPSLHSFVPSGAYSETKRTDGFWFGGPSLWTLLPSDGPWRLGYSSIDSKFREKLFWWR